MGKNCKYADCSKMAGDGSDYCRDHLKEGSKTSASLKIAAKINGYDPYDPKEHTKVKSFFSKKDRDSVTEEERMARGDDMNHPHMLRHMNLAEDEIILHHRKGTLHKIASENRLGQRMADSFLGELEKIGEEHEKRRSGVMLPAAVGAAAGLAGGYALHRVAMNKLKPALGAQILGSAQKAVKSAPAPFLQRLTEHFKPVKIGAAKLSFGSYSSTMPRPEEGLQERLQKKLPFLRSAKISTLKKTAAAKVHPRWGRGLDVSLLGSKTHFSPDDLEGMHQETKRRSRRGRVIQGALGAAIGGAFGSQVGRKGALIGAGLGALGGAAFGRGSHHANNVLTERILERLNKKASLRLTKTAAITRVGKSNLFSHDMTERGVTSSSPLSSGAGPAFLRQAEKRHGRKHSAIEDQDQGGS